MEENKEFSIDDFFEGEKNLHFEYFESKTDKAVLIGNNLGGQNRNDIAFAIIARTVAYFYENKTSEDVALLKDWIKTNIAGILLEAEKVYDRK